MTSSLVGSEMCIRDSSATLSTVTAHASQQTHLSIQYTPPGYYGLKPVSYTHLTLPTICSV
eukprot:11929021-Prorocentrum_lima.AAC.1